MLHLLTVESFLRTRRLFKTILMCAAKFTTGDTSHQINKNTPRNIKALYVRQIILWPLCCGSVLVINAVRVERSAEQGSEWEKNRRASTQSCVISPSHLLTESSAVKSSLLSWLTWERESFGRLSCSSQMLWMWTVILVMWLNCWNFGCHNRMVW